MPMREVRRMIVREIRPDDADRVTELYLDACRRLSERDADLGSPRVGSDQPLRPQDGGISLEDGGC
jgi:hypothetical protein